jgi:hypothetical protein
MNTEKMVGKGGAGSIKIKRVTDWTDCETCGSSYAEGAVIYIDGKEALDLAPVAHCFGGTNYDEDAILKTLLEHLGYEVEIEAAP